METLRLARATHQLLERGVEALEKIGVNWSDTTTDRSAPTTPTRDRNSLSRPNTEDRLPV
jgi:hypothetical protein